MKVSFFFYFENINVSVYFFLSRAQFEVFIFNRPAPREGTSSCETNI